MLTMLGLTARYVASTELTKMHFCSRAENGLGRAGARLPPDAKRDGPTAS